MGTGLTYRDSIWVKNQGTAPVQIGANVTDGPVIPPGAAQQVSFTYTGDGFGCAQLRFETLNASDSIDVLAYNPSVTVNGGQNLIPAANQNFTGWGTWQGSSVTITQEQTPVIVDSMDFLPYGEQIAGAAATTHKFTGDERDGETLLDHTWFRQYSSAQGRWLSPDPYSGSMDVTNPQSLNRYSYVINSPVNFTDPSGLVCGGGDWDDCFFNYLARMFGGGGGCTVNGIGAPCGFVQGLASSDAAVDCSITPCGPLPVTGSDGNYIGFAFPFYGADNSISYSFSFSFGNLTNAALAEMLGLPTQIGSASLKDPTETKYSDPKIWEVIISGPETKCDGRTNLFKVLVRPDSSPLYNNKAIILSLSGSGTVAPQFIRPTDNVTLLNGGLS